MSSGSFISDVGEAGNRLRRYCQVIAALLWHEEASRRRAPMESIVNLLEPIIMVGTLSLIWWFLGNRTFVILGGNPLLFYACGFFANYFFIYISRRMGRSIDSPNRRFPIERRLDHIIIHIILRIADYSVLGILVFGGLYLFVDANAMPYDIVSVAQALLALVMLGFGWGVLNVVMVNRVKLWSHIFPAFNRSMVLVSGVLFIPDFMSPPVRYILSFNPLLHALALFKTGFYPNYPTLLLDKSYLAWCAIIAVVCGLILERVTRRSELS